MTQLKLDIQKLWNPPVVFIDGNHWLEVMTKYGPYQFRFSNDTIFGRFTNIALLVSLIPSREQIGSDGKTYQLKYYPNLSTGKFNFVSYECNDFLDTLEPLVFGACEYDINGFKIC